MSKHPKMPETLLPGPHVCIDKTTQFGAERHLPIAQPMLTPEVRETWKALYRLARRRPDLGMRSRAMASNLLLPYSDDPQFRAVIAEQVAGLERALHNA